MSEREYGEQMERRRTESNDTMMGIGPSRGGCLSMQRYQTSSISYHKDGRNPSSQRDAGYEVEPMMVIEEFPQPPQNSAVNKSETYG